MTPHKPDPLIVMTHAGVSYIKSTSGYGAQIDRLLVNGDAPARCPGNPQWAMIEGEVSRIQATRPAGNKLIGYRLTEKFSGKGLFPEELGPGAFVYAGDDDDDSGWKPADASALYEHSFYTQVYERFDNPPVDYEFIVIDRDCEPWIQPGDVTVDFPHALREYPETWHKHPVSISAKAMFGRATSALKAAIANRPDDFTADDYCNIGTYTLKRYMNHKPRESTYQVGKKTKRTSSTRSTFEVMKIYEPSSNYKDGIATPRLSGRNWADLERQIDEFVSLIVSHVEPGSVGICPHCDGNGFIVKLPASV